MDPEERARRSAAAMWKSDAASQAFGMRIDEIGPGRAVLSMTVEAHHLNGHGICHGGVIFSLADSAFAFACNSHNKLAVAQTNQITFLAPVPGGERLTATAVEVARTGRTGLTDVTVAAAYGRPVALFRGQSRQIGGAHFEEEPDAP